MFRQLTTAGALARTPSSRTAVTAMAASAANPRHSYRHARVGEGHIQPPLCSGQCCVCDAALVVSTVAIAEVSLGKNDHGSLHTETVVQSTDVVIDPGFGERHAEARDPKRRLGEPNPVLRCGLDKARVHAVGG
jgi:hypothetical protein